MKNVMYYTNFLLPLILSNSSKGDNKTDLSDKVIQVNNIESSLFSNDPSVIDTCVEMYSSIFNDNSNKTNQRFKEHYLGRIKKLTTKHFVKSAREELFKKYKWVDVFTFNTTIVQFV